MTTAATAKGLPLQTNDRWLWEEHYPKHVNWRTPITPRRLDDLMTDAVARFGHHPAIDFMGKRWSYNDLGALIDAAAYGLQQRGVKKGVRVGLFLPNTVYSVIFYFGVLRAGGTVVNYNPLYVEKEIAQQIEDSQTDIMVTVDLKLTMDKMATMLTSTRLKKVIVCSFACSLPFPKNFLFPIAKRKDIAKWQRSASLEAYEDVVVAGKKPSAVDIDPLKDVAVLQYTGGTTGTPKGAALSHANIYANTVQLSLWMPSPVAGADSMVGVLPFFHVFAMTVVMNWSLMNGVMIHLQPKFDLLTVMKLINKHKPTFFPAVPAIFNAIANHSDVGKYNFRSLKFCFSGGAPLPVDVKRLFEEKTGVTGVVEGYGLTEASPVVTANPLDAARAGSIGMPVPQTVVEIISRDDGKTVLPTGEKGEVCIRGPQVMLGYHNRPKESAQVIKDGRLHTGDVGYMDDQGYIYLVDRIKDLILVRGYNVYPRIVEEAIYLHPAVEECIVAGVPDAERGETVWAWVKTAKGRSIDEKTLLEFLEDKLNPIEIPRRIIVRDLPLPKTTVGKLSRKDLLIQEGIRKI